LLGRRSTKSTDPQVKPILWDADGRRVIAHRWLEQWKVAAFSTGTNELVTVKSDGTIAVWDAITLLQPNTQPKVQFDARPDRWWAEISPDERWIAAIENDKVALLDRTNPKAAPRMLEGHHGDIKSAKFSRDGRSLVTASTDRTARVWRVDQRPGQPESFVELAGGHGVLASAAFNHDGQKVVTAGADNTIRVWDARNGRQLAVLHWHGEAVNEVWFDSDGQGILSASDDGTVKLGRCDACNQTVAQLRERIPDEAVLSPEELAKLQTESRAAIPFLQLPAFLSGRR
jgi:WD40 repeat protein